MNNWKTEIIMVAVFVLFFLFVYLPQKEQNKLMHEQIQALLKAQNALAKPTNALPNIVVPVIGGQNPIPPISDNPVIINTLPVNERVIAETIQATLKKLGINLAASQIVGIVGGLTKKPDTVKMGVTDATVSIYSPPGYDDRKLSEITLGELKKNIPIIVNPTVTVLEAERPASRIGTCYTTSGNGLSYRFSDTTIPLAGPLNLNGTLLLQESDFKLGGSLGKPIKGTMLEIQFGVVYNLQQGKPEVFGGGSVHW